MSNLLDDQLDIEAEDKFIKLPKVKYSLRHYEEINKYFSSKESLQEIRSKIPNYFMHRKINSPGCLTLVDADIADHLYSTMKPHLKNNSEYILEINAGLGVFTNLLLKENHHRLIIYESDSGFLKILRDKVRDAGSNARVHDVNLLNLWVLSNKDLIEKGTKIKDCFDGLPHKSWEDDPAVKIIVAVPSERFLLQTTYTILFQSGFYEIGRPEMFVTMTPLTYMKLTARPDAGGGMYRSRAALFQIVFDHEILTKVPDKSYVPWMGDSCKSLKTAFKPKKGEEDLFYVVKVTARKDLFQRVSPDLMKPLWFFVRLFLHKRHTSVIAIMEKWVPGCGVQLISQGHTIYTKTGSLSPEQIFDLFMQFVSWPEFKTCSFLSSMESLMVRMTEPSIVEEMEASRSIERDIAEIGDEAEAEEYGSDSSEDGCDPEEDSEGEKVR